MLKLLCKYIIYFIIIYSVLTNHRTNCRRLNRSFPSPHYVAPVYCKNITGLTTIENFDGQVTARACPPVRRGIRSRPYGLLSRRVYFLDENVSTRPITNRERHDVCLRSIHRYYNILLKLDKNNRRKTVWAIESYYPRPHQSWRELKDLRHLTGGYLRVYIIGKPDLKVGKIYQIIVRIFLK